MRFERTDERFALLLNARTAEQRADTAQLRADFEGSLRRMQTVLLSAFLTLAGVLIALSVFDRAEAQSRISRYFSETTQNSP